MSTRAPLLAVLLLRAPFAAALGSPALDELLQAAGRDTLPAAPDVASAGPDEMRARLLARAVADDRKAPVWSGYRVLERPVLLYGRDAVYLFREGQAASRLTVAPPTPRLPPGAFTFDAPFQDDRVFVLHPDPEQTPLDHVRTVVHERFHAYQGDSMIVRSRGASLEAPSPRHWALSAVEQECLLEALRGGSGWERAARMFAAVRGERRRELGPAAADKEDALESLEGLAFYVDTRFYHRAAGDGSAPETNARLKQRLTPSFDAYAMTRDRYYATGAGMAFLLDRKSARGWKSAAGSGEPLTDLFGAAFGPGEPGLVAEAMARHDFTGLLASAERRLAADQDEASRALAAFKASPGLRFSLAYPGAYGASVDRRGRDVRTAEGTLGDYRSLKMRGAGLTGAITDKAVLYEPDGFLFHLAAEPAIAVDGEPLPALTGRLDFRRVVIAAEGFTLDTERPGSIERTKAGLSLTWVR